MAKNTQFNQEKYDQILTESGLSAALTQIQNDLKRLEQECFEGKDGYQPEVYEEMKKYRKYSEKLWAQRYD